MHPYVLRAICGLSEEVWVLHTDIPQEGLGEDIRGHYHYEPILFKLLAAYHTHTLEYKVGFTAPIPMIAPYNFGTFPIHKHVIITEAMAYVGHREEAKTNSTSEPDRRPPRRGGTK